VPTSFMAAIMAIARTQQVTDGMGREFTLDAISACDVSLSDRRNVASSADDVIEKRTCMVLRMAPRTIASLP